MRGTTKHLFIILVGLILLGSIGFGNSIDEPSRPTLETKEQFKRAGEAIRQAVTFAGGLGTSGSETLSSIVGQLAIGNSTSGEETLSHGFWPSSESGPCNCEPGEADGAPPINILDIVYIINFKYKSGPSPIPYATCSADADADCTVNILDVVYVINYKYKSGPAPSTCEEWTTNCGSLR